MVVCVLLSLVTCPHCCFATAQRAHALQKRKGSRRLACSRLPLGWRLCQTGGSISGRTVWACGALSLWLHPHCLAQAGRDVGCQMSALGACVSWGFVLGWSLQTSLCQWHANTSKPCRIGMDVVGVFGLSCRLCLHCTGADNSAERLCCLPSVISWMHTSVDSDPSPCGTASNASLTTGEVYVSR